MIEKIQESLQIKKKRQLKKLFAFRKILATVQAKDSQGASGAITGSTTNNFYEKNKGRTKDGALKKATVGLGVLFAIGTIGLSFLYLM